MKNKTAYLFGNGINRTRINDKDIYEWSNLLEDINKEFCEPKINNIKTKEFPFAYDEIVNHTHNLKHKKEVEIKKFIQDGIDKLEANHRYSNLRNLKCDEILTTNYDYLLERNLYSGWERKKFTPDAEKSYSLNRYQTSAEKKIWHIHGEQGMKSSILLGFRHYINYSAQVKARAQKGVLKLKGEQKDIKDSWVDLFFTHDIYIVGQGMKFTEYPLWWLLAYRHYKNKIKETINLNNKIHFITPEFSLKSNQNLVDNLKSYDINIIPVDVDDQDYDGFYNAVLNNEISK